MSKESLNNGLVAYWDLDEDSGTSKKSHDGNNTLVEGAAGALSVSGVRGQAFHADGAGPKDCIGIAGANKVGLDFTTDFTVAMWINIDPAEVGSFNRFISNTSGTNGYVLYFNWNSGTNPGIVMQLLDNSVPSFTSLYASIVKGEDYFCVYRHSRTGGSPGLDTADVFTTDSQVATAVTDTTTVSGGASGAGADFVLGSTAITGGGSAIISTMDNLGLWNRQLTDAEVQELWNNGKGRSYKGYLGPPSLETLYNDPDSLNGGNLRKRKK